MLLVNAAHGETPNTLPWGRIKVEDLCHCKYNEEEELKQDDFAVDKCNFNDAIKISREWCKGNDIENITHSLGISKSVVSEVYHKASNVAENFIKSNIKDWQIGGPGTVVIIDTYPEGCANTNLIGRRLGRPILCISEVKTMPQKYWLETLDSYDSSNLDQIQSIKQHIMQTISSIVLPGTILVTPYASTLLSRTDFDSLNPLYPTIVSVKDLSRHNTEEQSVFSNLATIWKSVLDVCEEAQFYNSVYVRQFIINHMWRRRYDDRSFEIFLYELSQV